MINLWRSLSPITRSFLIGMLAAGPVVWACMVAFLILLG
jgi:hypothetical protein